MILKVEYLKMLVAIISRWPCTPNDGLFVFGCLYSDVSEAA